MRLDGMTGWRVPGHIRSILGVAPCIMVVILCTSIRTRPPQHRARPISSASAPSSVNLAPTKTRQVRRPAKLVQPILTALLKLQVVSTMPPAVQQEHMLVEPQLVLFVALENTMTKRDAQQKLIANLIATPDHTSHVTKVRV